MAANSLTELEHLDSHRCAACHSPLADETHCPVCGAAAYPRHPELTPSAFTQHGFLYSACVFIILGIAGFIVAGVTDNDPRFLPWVTEVAGTLGFVLTSFGVVMVYAYTGVRRGNGGPRITQLPGNHSNVRRPAPWWLLMLLTLIAVPFAFVAVGTFMLCAGLIFAGEFDHGGVQALMIGLFCYWVVGILVCAGVRWK